MGDAPRSFRAREHPRIAAYFAPLAQGEPGSFHLNDDAAILTVPEGAQLVVTTDSVIEAVHVFPGATPQQFARKLLRRNLSDLAAMGANPWRYTLNLHTPEDTSDDWFAAFAETLAAEQAEFNMILAGGDTTFGMSGAPMHATMTCFGIIHPIAGPPLRRNGARIGDDIYVSGTIGDAALGLLVLQGSSAGDPHLIDRYHRPQPRLNLGQTLRCVATSAVDISDGLLADLQHICTASGVGAEIRCSAIPLSAAAQQMLHKNASLSEKILTGGDDYELCFTASHHARETLARLAEKLSLPLTRIGTVTTGAQVVVVEGWPV